MASVSSAIRIENSFFCIGNSRIPLHHATKLTLCPEEILLEIASMDGKGRVYVKISPGADRITSCVRKFFQKAPHIKLEFDIKGIQISKNNSGAAIDIDFCEEEDASLFQVHLAPYFFKEANCIQNTGTDTVFRIRADFQDCNSSRLNVKLGCVMARLQQHLAYNETNRAIARALMGNKGEETIEEEPQPYLVFRVDPQECSQIIPQKEDDSWSEAPLASSDPIETASLGFIAHQKRALSNLKQVLLILQSIVGDAIRGQLQPMIETVSKYEEETEALSEEQRGELGSIFAEIPRFIAEHLKTLQQAEWDSFEEEFNKKTKGYGDYFNYLN